MLDNWDNRDTKENYQNKLLSVLDFQQYQLICYPEQLAQLKRKL